MRAFTLIELLVTVAVIALLVGLLLPALSKSREAGRLAVCVSNQRQCALGVQMYMDTYHAVPLANEDMPGTQYTANLVGDIDAIDYHPDMFTCPNLMRRDRYAFFSYYAGAMLTNPAGCIWGEGGGNDPIPELVWPVTRHFEEFPTEWMWTEPYLVHEGRSVATRLDGSHVVDTRNHIWDEPVKH